MEESKLRQSIKEITGQNVEIPENLAPVLEALLQALEREKRLRMDREALLAFFKASADAMPNPIFIKDQALRFVFFNRAYREFFGLGPRENLGKRVQDLSYLSEEERLRYDMEDAKMLEALSVLQYETMFENASGETVEALYWSKGFPVPETGQRGVIGEIVDISGEKAVQRELASSMRALELLMKDAKNASNTDPLTRLYNRNIMKEEVPMVIHKAEMMGQPVCLLLMDVDHFKGINDAFGHPYGDEVLSRFSEILRHTFRQQDIAVRYGGDEFLMVLPGAGLPQAAAGAERLRGSVAESIVFPDGRHATLSIGVAAWQAGDTLETCIHRADQALYEAKAAGRDRVVIGE